LIASGSTPEEGAFEGKEHCITSDDVFAMEELPKSIVVIGGGYIAIEMAQIF
jgi:glutathione reductase (NADPH)